MVRQGIFFTGINTDWDKAVLGAMLVIAVLVNRCIRTRAAQERH